MLVTDDEDLKNIEIECRRNGEDVLLKTMSVKVPYHKIKPVLETCACKSCKETCICSSKDKKLQIFPTEINTETDNTIIIQSTISLLGGCEIMLGSYSVPSENISVLDRFRLKVTLPANKCLQLQPGKTVTLSVLVNDIASESVFLPGEIGLLRKSSTPDKVDKEFSVEPSQATSEKIITINSLQKFDMTTVKEVWFNGKDNKQNPASATANKLTCIIPKLPLSTDGAPLPVTISLVTDNGSKEIKNAFNYEFPTSAVSTSVTKTYKQ